MDILVIDCIDDEEYLYDIKHVNKSLLAHKIYSEVIAHDA